VIVDTIKKDLDEARKAKRKDVVTFLSTIYSDVVMFGKNNGNRQTTDEEAIKIMKNFQSKSEEVIDLLKKKDPSRVLEYEDKIKLLQKYIPKQLTEEELTEVIQNYIKDFDINDKKIIGLVMNKLKENYAGMFDGKLASKIIKNFSK